MAGQCHNKIERKKKERPIDRETNAALYALRCLQAGLSFADLEMISFGFANDIFTEAHNDNYDYPLKATQADIDRL